MDFNEYIMAECMALIPVLYIIGAMLKNCKRFADEYIPFAVCGVGVVLASLLIITTNFPANGQEWAAAITSGIMQGFLCAGASVYCNQIVKQGEKLKQKDSPENYMEAPKEGGEDK